MKVYIGADHRGFALKSQVIKAVEELGYKVVDVGTDDPETSCDYPVFAYQVAKAAARSKDNRGILICMSGIGQAIAANKVPGCYAALCYNDEALKLSREHNNANVLVLSGKFSQFKSLKNALRVWLTTKFEGGRHQRRLNLIKKIEKGYKITCAI